MRMHGHAEHDPADYVVKELYEEYSKKDPVELFENVLLKGGVLDDDTVKKVRDDARQAAIAAPAQGARRPDARTERHRGRRVCRLTAGGRIMTATPTVSGCRA